MLRCFVLGAIAATAGAQTSKTENRDLFEAILRMDHHLSDAFNAHNADRLLGMATNDLEYYDENGGRKDFQQCFEQFRTIFAGSGNVRRELIEGSAEVYELKGYGAYEVGQNRQCHTENGKEECHVSKFAIIWQKQDETWKLSRFVSYGQ